jgi:hypothetical protein
VIGELGVVQGVVFALNHGQKTGWKQFPPVFSLWTKRNASQVLFETLPSCKVSGPREVVGGGESIFALHQIGWYSCYRSFVIGPLCATMGYPRWRMVFHPLYAGIPGEPVSPP